MRDWFVDLPKTANVNGGFQFSVQSERVDLSPSRYPLLLRFYREFLDHEDSARFIRAVTLHYTSATLERLSVSCNRAVRRAAILALGLTADYTANAVLGRALNDQDRAVRLLAENGLKAVWRRQGSAAQRRQLDRVIWAIRSGDYTSAVAEAGSLLRAAPNIAEAWRQRGLAYFYQRRFRAALGDFRQTLELNPYHFAAAAAIGYCQCELNDPIAALESFRQALLINPGMDDVRVQVQGLQRALDRG